MSRSSLKCWPSVALLGPRAVAAVEGNAGDAEFGDGHARLFKHGVSPAATITIPSARAGRGRTWPAAPDQKQPGVARNALGEIDDAGGKAKALRAQLVLPEQIDLRRLAAQRHRPVRRRGVDRPPAVAAELARKTQEHEFLFAVLRRQPRVVDQLPPPLARDVRVDQLADPVAAASSFPARAAALRCSSASVSWSATR